MQLVKKSSPKLDSTYVTIAGRRMHARVSVHGPGKHVPNVVLVHGLGVSSHYMVPTALRLAPYCSVYAPDLPGFGKSDDPPLVLDVPGMADAIEAWMEAMGLRSAAFIGNSMGCQVIIDLAARYPERVQRAVLTGPTFDRAARASIWSLLGRVVRDGHWEPRSLSPIIVFDYLSAGPIRIIRTLRYGLQDPVEAKLPYVKVPVLLVRGAHDSVVPLSWIRLMSRLLPISRIVVIQGAPHAVNFAAPGKLTRVSLPFLGFSVPERIAGQDHLPQSVRIMCRPPILSRITLRPATCGTGRITNLAGKFWKNIWSKASPPAQR